MKAERAELRLLAVSVVLAAGVFILDLSIPLGVAGGVPYVALVLVSLWSPRRRPTVMAATAGTILTILGYFLSPAGGVLWMVLFNRGLALFAIWITAILALQRKRSEATLRRAYDDLDVLVQRRTAALRESETRSRAIVDSAADGIIIIDEHSIIESFNTAAEEAFGYAAKEVIGQNVKMLMPSPHQEEHDAYVARYLETGDPQVLGKRQRLLEGRRKDGTIFPIELTVDEVRLPDKRRFVGILRDITERKQAETALKESEQRFRAISDYTYDWENWVGADGKLLWVNPAVERITGYTVEECLAMPDYPHRLILEEDRDMVRETFKAAVAERTSGNDLPFGIRHKDGTIRWVAVSWQPIYGNDGVCLGHRSSIRDMTEHKRVEAALQESEDKFMEVFHTSEDAILLLDGETFVDCNQAAATMLGCTGAGQGDLPQKGKLLSTHLPGLCPALQPDGQASVEKAKEMIEIAFKDGSTRFEWTIHRTNGEELPAEVSLTSIPLQGRQVLYCVVKDVTDRKRAEQALAERVRQSALGADVGVALTHGESTEHMLQICSDAMVHHLDAAFARIWTLNEKENVLELQASAGMYTHLDGHHARVPVGELKIGMIAQERRPHMTNAVVDDPRISDKEWARREGMVAFAGHPLIVEDRVVGVMALFARQPFTDATLNALGSVADQIALGIERKRAEEALRESEQRLQAILDNTTAVIYMKNADGRYVLINRRFEELFHVTREEIVGKTDYDVVPREHADALRENDRKVLKMRTPLEFEEVVPQDDGLHSYISIKFPVLNAAGTPYAVCGVSTDITARKRAEEEARKRHQELAHVAHLDAIGGIATDLARELKRPLAGIENYIQTCLVKARTGSAEPRELLDDMEHAAIQARRAGEIVDRIHEFIRARGPRRAAVGINKLVREAADLVESEVRDNGVKVRMELAEKLPSVMVESTQIEQVIVNLIRNGLEAMADGRTKDRRLTIETSRANSGSVGCRIRDAGPGLPEEAIERIFEPFYTTKANGLGVGLSISQSIVEAHGGHLWASVNPDHGTTFQFTLPIS